MIPVEIYSTVYYAVITGFIFLFACLRLYSPNRTYIENYKINRSFSFILLTIVILFIGLRDPYGSFEYLGDTSQYTAMYENINTVNILNQKDIGFMSLMKISYMCGLSINFFFIFCAFLYAMLPYLTFRKWFSANAFYALAIYVGAMSFWGFGINGVRSGLAASFFIYALGLTDKKWSMVFFMALSVLFHKSMLLPIAAFISTRWFWDTKKLTFIWGLCIIICLLFGSEISKLIFYFIQTVDDIRGSAITLDNTELTSAIEAIRFRFDFILYSAVPIILGWFFIYKKGYRDKFYCRLLNTYIIANSCWILLFMYQPYTNRFAYLSWFIMPVLMVYPLLKERIMANQYRFLALLLLCNILFTIILF